MNPNAQITIEKLVYGGEGLARIENSQGPRKTVFVPFVLPGEHVEVSLVEERPGFARGNLLRVISPSADRSIPPCVYFERCGGCHYQHTNYESQLELKRGILRETVQRIAKVELPEIVLRASPPLHYRNRTRMQLGKDSDGSFALGYRRWKSHSLLPVKECPISSKLINRAIHVVWLIGTEQPVPDGLQEIEFFADHEDQRLMIVFLVGKEVDRRALKSFAEELRTALPEICGAAVLPHPRAARADTVAAPELDSDALQPGSALTGSARLEYRVGTETFSVNAGAFFQTNRFLIEDLVKAATAGASGKHAFDLYAGVGLFSRTLARDFERVTAVEASPASFRDLSHTAPRNVKAVNALSEAFLARSGAKPDFVLVDPPRNGLGRKVAAGLAKLAPKSISYVSCDPSTLARDLTCLLTEGYRIREAHLLDMFPQTFHIETVLRLEH